MLSEWGSASSRVMLTDVLHSTVGEDSKQSRKVQHKETPAQKMDASSHEQVRRFQQHSSSLPAVPTRYLEQLERPKHRFLAGDRKTKAPCF